MPSSRTPPAWRRAFLRALSRCANVTLAARVAGIDQGGVYAYRQRNPAFARAWARALAIGEARVAREAYAVPPLDPARPRVLSRCGHGGRLKLITPAPDRWNEEKEERFFDALMACGNLTAAAARVGVSFQTIYKRRLQWPEFDNAVRETCAIAAEDLNRQLIRAGSNTLVPPTIALGVETVLVSVDQAIRIVQMNLPGLRDKAGAARRPGTAAQREPTVEEVCARIEETLSRLPEEGDPKDRDDG